MDVSGNNLDASSKNIDGVSQKRQVIKRGSGTHTLNLRPAYHLPQRVTLNDRIDNVLSYVWHRIGSAVTKTPPRLSKKGHRAKSSSAIVALGVEAFDPVAICARWEAKRVLIEGANPK